MIFFCFFRGVAGGANILQSNESFIEPLQDSKILKGIPNNGNVCFDSRTVTLPSLVLIKIQCVAIGKEITVLLSLHSSYQWLRRARAYTAD